MRLEDIVSMYGWNDYLDIYTGCIYKLSTANKVQEDNLAYVDVIDLVNQEFIGTAIMEYSEG